MARLERAAREEGLPFAARKRTYNSRLAQELGKWAETMGKGHTFHDAAFRAYFAEDMDIGKVPELVNLAKSIGLPEREALEILETRAFKQAVDSDWSRSYSEDITTIPTLVMNDRALVGARPYETMEKFIRTSGARKRKTVT